MLRKRSIVIRTLVTAVAAVTLVLGGAELSAGTALAATAQSASAAAHTSAVQPAEATHWVIYSEDLPNEEQCYELGESMMEYGLVLDFICFPSVSEGECTSNWTLEIELPGGDSSPNAAAKRAAKPAVPAC